MNTKIENPKPDEKVCFNCQHMLWGVGIGVGVLCKATKDKKGQLFKIPGRLYSCEKFEFRKKE